MKVWQNFGWGIGLVAIASGCSGPVVAFPDLGTSTDSAPAVAILNLPSATVVSVGDGDTLRMDYRGENITVRLACIDAPETSQTPWGPVATDRLRQLIPRNSTIQFREAGTDRYGRMVAEIYAGGQNMNLKLVREGHAVVYTQFLHRCPETQDALLAAEEQARQQRLNFWNQPNPVMPWDYRRRNR
ncbi:MAG: thermonuclease family protein [Leptolyngbya sp. LCM1.Bin17]|nr:MAG: thermonuclease family protein [Leptolyngbya sp. LCM1.Bin17]